ncbi:hypothetical protein [Microbacterium sp. XT11]|nr:hypothetical protein [Microbacterium sp. XT11]
MLDPDDLAGLVSAMRTVLAPTSSHEVLERRFLARRKPVAALTGG